MSGVALRLGFDDGPIRAHLARLSILDRRGFDSARREIGEFMVGDIQDNLDGQRLADGSPMPQSKAARTGEGRTGRERRKGKIVGKGKPGKTLIDSHLLYDSYVYQLDGRLGLEVGSEMVYAAIHHFGGETGRRNARFTLPPRPVMGFGAAQERQLGDILIADIVRTQGGGAGSGART
jgi:phage gpG-like protein